MDRRQFVISAFGAGLAALGVEGCGGGGGSSVGAGGGSQTQTVRGVVKLPPGFSLKLTDLSIDNAAASTPLSASATFSAQVQPTVPSLVLLRHNSDRGVMFGFVDPTSATITIDARAQAVALLYLALDGYTIPVENKRQVLGLIASDPSIGPLTAAVNARLAANPFAFEDGDAQIGAALQTAFNAIKASSRAGRSITTPSGSGILQPGKLSDIQDGSTRASAIPLQLLVTPTSEQSGVEVLQDSNSIGVLATNHYRRRCQVLTYITGIDDVNGVHTDYPLAKAVGAPVVLGSTTALGIFSTLQNLFSGNTAFTPVSTPVIPLAMAQGAAKTYFDMVVLGSANNQNPEPAFFSDPRYANEVAGWRATRGNLNQESLVADTSFGLLVELCGFTFAVPAEVSIQSSIAGLYAIPDARITNLLKDVYLGHISDNLNVILGYLADNTSFGLAARSQYAYILQKAQEQAALRAAQSLPGRMLALIGKMLARALGVAGLILGAGDLGSVIHDLTVADDADLWNVTLLQPTLQISPPSVTIQPGGSQTFSAKLPVGVTGSIVYDWSTTALIGVLSDGAGKTGRSFETSVATVTLQTTPSDVSPLTVSVTAYQVAPGGGRSTIGDAKATVTLSTTAPKTIPAGKLYLENFPVNGGLFGYAFVAAWFYTFQYDPNAINYYVSDGFNVDYELYQTQIQKGAPVLTAANFGDIRGYASGFYNLGNGLIGVPAYQLAGTQVTQAPLVRQDVNAAAKGHTGTVRIMY